MLNSTRPTSRSGTIWPSSSTARYSLNTQPRPPYQLTSHHDSSRRQPLMSTGSPSRMTSTLGNSTSGPVRKLTSAIVKACSACAAAAPKVAKAIRKPTIRNRITFAPRSINYSTTEEREQLQCISQWGGPARGWRISRCNRSTMCSPRLDRVRKRRNVINYRRGKNRG
jgi:hypothetical protein